MRILEESISLVVAGAWNPAILTPNWIVDKAMERGPGHEFQVQVELPMMNLGFGSMRPRLAFEGISVLAEPGALTFKLQYDDVAQANLSTHTAAKILQLLPHTPVSAYGFNFGFEFDQPSNDLLDTFSGTSFLPGAVPDPDARLVKQEWSGTLFEGGRLMAVGAVLEGEVVRIHINVHTEAGSATAVAEQLLADDLFQNIKGDVDALINKFRTNEGEQ